MTRVDISVKENKFRMHSEGHAGWGKANGLEDGHDIVCAAISILTQTAAQRLMDMEAGGNVRLVSLRVEPGIVDMEAEAHGTEDRVKELAETMKTGFDLIHKAYESYVILGWEKNDFECDTV